MQTISCTWRSVVPIGEDPAAHNHWCTFTDLYHIIPCHTGVNTSDAAGAIPGVVPFDVASGWPADPSWSAAVIAVPHAVWKRTGDLGIVRAAYTSMVAYANFLLRHLTDGLVQYGMLGDWLSIEDLSLRDGDAVRRVSAFSAASNLAELATMAAAIGNTADATRFRRVASSMRSAYHTQFFNASLGAYGTRRCAQTASILPLALGCVPAALVANATAALVESLVMCGLGEPTIKAGQIGTRHVLQALVSVGREDLALRLVLKTTPPSWGHMLSQGPGTFWEEWLPSFAASSKNHHAFTGGVGLFIHDSVAGVHVAAAHEGHMILTFQPLLAVAQVVRAASATIAVGGGVASIAWRHHPATSRAERCQPAALDVNVTVPVSEVGGFGVQTTVRIPVMPGPGVARVAVQTLNALRRDRFGAWTNVWRSSVGAGALSSAAHLLLLGISDMRRVAPPLAVRDELVLSVRATGTLRFRSSLSGDNCKHN